MQVYTYIVCSVHYYIHDFILGIFPIKFLWPVYYSLFKLSNYRHENFYQFMEKKFGVCTKVLGEMTGSELTSSIVQIRWPRKDECM